MAIQSKRMFTFPDGPVTIDAFWDDTQASGGQVPVLRIDSSNSSGHSFQLGVRDNTLSLQRTNWYHLTLGALPRTTSDWSTPDA